MQTQPKKKLARYFHTTGATKTLPLAIVPPRKRKADETDDQSHENKAKHRQRTGTEETEQSATAPYDVLPNHKPNTIN